jgi:hypothetical protein
VLDARGAHAPRRPATVTPPQVRPGQTSVRVAAGIGDYRAGDEIWCETLGPDAFRGAVNFDVLVPRPGGRFAFGRLIALDDGMVTLVPPDSGSTPQSIANPAWIARATRLVRTL